MSNKEFKDNAPKEKKMISPQGSSIFQYNEHKSLKVHSKPYSIKSIDPEIIYVLIEKIKNL